MEVDMLVDTQEKQGEEEEKKTQRKIVTSPVVKFVMDVPSVECVGKS